MLFEALALMGLHGVGYALNTQTGKNDADKYGIYLDGNGCWRLKKNGKRVVDSYNDYGEHIMKYVGGMYDGIEAINISKIEAEQRKREAINNKENIYLSYIESGHGTNRPGNNMIKGCRYQEINGENKCMVICHINYYDNNPDNDYKYKTYYGDYYMDMNYNFLYPTKETILKDKAKYQEDFENIENLMVLTANERINKLKEEYKHDNYMLNLLLPNNCSINLKDYSYNDVIHKQMQNIKR